MNERLCEFLWRSPSISLCFSDYLLLLMLMRRIRLLGCYLLLVDRMTEGQRSFSQWLIFCRWGRGGGRWRGRSFPECPPSLLGGLKSSSVGHAEKRRRTQCCLEVIIIIILTFEGEHDWLLVCLGGIVISSVENIPVSWSCGCRGDDKSALSDC